MPDSNEKINQLQTRLDKMVEYQDYFYREINQIRAELKTLKTSNSKDETTKPPIVEQPVPPIETAAKPFPRPPVERQRQPENTTYQSAKTPPVYCSNSNVEEFVGKNLISLIGIIITVLGVGIGAKYAIDRNLISPTARILIGYAFATRFARRCLLAEKEILKFQRGFIERRVGDDVFFDVFCIQFLQFNSANRRVCLDGFLYRLYGRRGDQFQSSGHRAHRFGRSIRRAVFIERQLRHSRRFVRNI